jgi:hypothetical protein
MKRYHKWRGYWQYKWLHDYNEYIPLNLFTQNNRSKSGVKYIEDDKLESSNSP